MSSVLLRYNFSLLPIANSPLAVICPLASILNLSVPEVLKAIVSASGNLIFVFESPVWYIVSETSKLPVTVKLSLTVVLPIKVGIVPVVVCIVPNEPVPVDEPLIFPSTLNSEPPIWKATSGVPLPCVPILFSEESVLNKGLLVSPFMIKSTLLLPSLNVISCGALPASFKSMYDIPPILNLSLSFVKLR